MSLLVWGAGGWNEQEPVEGAMIDNAPGNEQMAGVYRVERSPVNAKPMGFHGELPLSDSPCEDPSVAAGPGRELP